MIVRRAIMGTLIAATLLAVPVQFVIDSSAENLACVCIVAASSLSVLLYIAWSRAVDGLPLSTFALLGFCVTTQLGAVLVQTLAWTAVSKSLYSPLYTFGILAFYQGIALASHAAYSFFRSSNSSTPGIFRGLLRSAGVYRIPPCGALWFMGCTGLVSIVFSRYEGPLANFIGAFNFLAWAPFLIPFYLRDVGGSYCNASRSKWLLGCYVLAIGIEGIALNARGIMFVGVVTVGLLYLLAGMRSPLPVTRRAMVGLGALAVGLLVLSGPLSDLTTSMAVARQWRGKVSPIEMITTTYSILKRPALIAAARADAAARARYSAYDEYYIANPLLARFVTTKYHDNMLHYAGAITTDANKAILRDISVKFLLSVVPGPVLDSLHIGNKEILNSSIGDYLAYLGGGVRKGGHAVGSIFAHGIALFGPLFPFIYAGLCLGLFSLMDLLTIRSANRAVTISALGILQIWTYFSAGIVYDGLHGPFYFFVRNFWQTALIYALVLKLACWVSGARQAPDLVSNQSVPAIAPVPGRSAGLMR